MYVLNHTNDKDDDQKVTFVPLTCKRKVEHGMQGTSMEAPLENIMDVSAVSNTGPPTAAIPPGAPPAVVGSVPTAGPHAAVPPTSCAAVPPIPVLLSLLFLLQQVLLLMYLLLLHRKR